MKPTNIVLACLLCLAASSACRADVILLGDPTFTYTDANGTINTDEIDAVGVPEFGEAPEPYIITVTQGGLTAAIEFSLSTTLDCTLIGASCSSQITVDQAFDVTSQASFALLTLAYNDNDTFSGSSSILSGGLHAVAQSLDGSTNPAQSSSFMLSSGMYTLEEHYSLSAPGASGDGWVESDLADPVGSVNVSEGGSGVFLGITACILIIAYRWRYLHD